MIIASIQLINETKQKKTKEKFILKDSIESVFVLRKKPEIFRFFIQYNFFFKSFIHLSKIWHDMTTNKWYYSNSSRRRKRKRRRKKKNEKLVWHSKTEMYCVWPVWLTDWLGFWFFWFFSLFHGNILILISIWTKKKIKIKMRTFSKLKKIPKIV